MQIQKVSYQHNYSPNFGFKYQLSKETISSIGRTTKLTYDEMKNLTISEAKELMRKRGTLKEPGRFKTWLADKYKKLGEALGLLKKEYNIYTHID